MSSSGNQLPQAAVTVVAAGNPDAFPGTEERDWANLVGDAVRHIAGKLLAADAAEYVRLRAVCTPWRSATAAPTWEPQFFPRNWLMLRNDVVADAAAPTAPARRRFVNVRTGATLRIRPPPTEEYGDFIGGAEGLLLFHCGRTDTVRVFNPHTAATAGLPGLAGVPGVEEALEMEVAAAGVVADGNARPAVVLALVLPGGATVVVLCARPGDDRWRTVDAGEVAAPPLFQCGLSFQGCFYVPTRHGEVLRVQLYPQPRLVYVARPPGSRHCTCDVAVTSYLVPSLDDDGASDDNDGMLLVRMFEGAIEVLGLHLGNGSYTRVPELGNRCIFLTGLTVRADKLSSIAEMELGSVHLDEDIEDYIIG